MREIPPTWPHFAVRELRGRGIEFRIEHDGRGDHRPSSVRSPTGEACPTRTRGVDGRRQAAPGRRPASACRSTTAGASRSTATMQVDGPPTTSGRSATPPPCPTRPSKRSQPSPPTAQHALRQGGAWRRTSPPRIGDGQRRARSATRRSACSSTSGRHQAVASTLGIRWRGFPAWFLARTYHLAAMPGLRRRLRLVVDWTVDLLFAARRLRAGAARAPAALDGSSTSSRTSAGGTAAPAHDGQSRALVPSGAGVIVTVATNR